VDRRVTLRGDFVVCCSVLQRVCCSMCGVMLWCVAVCCNVLQRVCCSMCGVMLWCVSQRQPTSSHRHGVWHYDVALHTTTSPHILQHTRCNTLPGAMSHLIAQLVCGAMAYCHPPVSGIAVHLQHTATLCDTLQHTVTLQHCNTMQHAATHCSTLQHAATNCNTPGTRVDA